METVVGLNTVTSTATAKIMAFTPLLSLVLFTASLTYSHLSEDSPAEELEDMFSQFRG